MPRYTKRNNEPKEFDEKVVRISRVSKKTKGGNKIGFTALVVIGDRKGRVGVALGKANDVLSAIKKGVRKAKKRLVKVPLDGSTIPHEITIKHGASRIILKPAPEGTGVIAGGSVRSVLELAGIRNVVAKILGTNNKLSNVTTTFLALKKIRSITETKKALGQLPLKKARSLTKSTNPSTEKPAPESIKNSTKKSTKKISKVAASKKPAPSKAKKEPKKKSTKSTKKTK